MVIDGANDAAVRFETGFRHVRLNSGTVTFGDFKTFDGIPIARRERDGYLEPNVTSFRVVDRFDPRLFDRP